jgi:hypothetical protein
MSTRTDWRDAHRTYREGARGFAPEVRRIVAIDDTRRHLGRSGDWTSIGHAAAWLHLASIARRRGNTSEARHCVTKAKAQRAGASSRLPT